MNTAARDSGISGPSGPIGSQVAQRLAEVTRFDAHDLAFLDTEEPFRVEVSLYLTQEVTFDITSYRSTGKLPDGIDRISARGLDDIQPALDRQYYAFYERLPTALQGWAARDTVTYRRLLESASELGIFATRLGCEIPCGACNGSGAVWCTECHGLGATGCGSCLQIGQVPCSACSGSGKSHCYACHGVGSVSETVFESVWDSVSNQYVQQVRQINQLCQECGGRGGVTCSRCGGRRRVECDQCDGSGKIKCRTCAGSQWVGCHTCDASGLLHAVGVVTPALRYKESVSATGISPELQRILTDRLRPQDLSQFGDLRTVIHDIDGYRLVSRYVLFIVGAKTRIAIKSDSSAAGQFVFHGLGDGLQVVDHCNIEARLLEGDLAALESAVKQAAGNDLTRDALVRHTKVFIESELNWLILEQVAGRAASTQQVNSEVERHFAGMVDSSYIARSVAALRRSFTMSHRSTVLKPAAVFVGVITLLVNMLWELIALRILQSTAAWLTGGLLAIASAMCWLALERFVASEIESIFSEAYGRRVWSKLKSSGQIARVRMVAASVLLVTVLAVHFVVDSAKQRFRLAANKASVLAIGSARGIAVPAQSILARSNDVRRVQQCRPMCSTGCRWIMISSTP